MKLSTFLRIKMVMSLAFGILLVIAPTVVARFFFGSTLEPVGMLMGRVVGALLTGIGVLCWLSSQLPAHHVAPEILLALFVGDTLAFLVGLIAQLGPLSYPMGWLNVTIWLFFATGFAYFRFLLP